MNEEEAGAVRSELLGRLRSLESSQPEANLAELAYKRARDALERALEEARSIRLQALDDARLTRERELASLLASMRSLRQSAESQIETLLRTAEIEAARLRDNAKNEAEMIVERATSEADQIRADAQAVRTANEERQKAIEGMEADLNRLLAKIATRLGIKDRPVEGWWSRITGRHSS